MACWQQITAPVLVVSGADSSFFADAAGPNAIDVLTGAQMVVIPDAGHMLHFEQPAKLAAAVEKVLIV
jgi:pimeloyl-ACP methyl ester carboxylesterase